MWDDDCDGESWISDSDLSENDPITKNELFYHQFNVDQDLNWGNMADDEPFQS